MIAMAVLLQAPPRGDEIAHSEEQRLVILVHGLRGRSTTVAGALEGATTDLGRRVSAVAAAGIPVVLLPALDHVRWDGDASGETAGGRTERVAA